MPDPQLPPGFDFTDPDIYAERLPVEEFAELRRSAPLWWNAQPADVGGFGDGGFWVVTSIATCGRCRCAATCSRRPRNRWCLATR